MRKTTIRNGLRLLIVATLLVIAASFYHGPVAGLLALSPAGDVEFVYLAFFWSGILGGVGIVLVMTGLMRSGSSDRAIRLTPVLVGLLAAICLFFVLFFRSFTAPDTPPRLRPGETVII